MVEGEVWAGGCTVVTALFSVISWGWAGGGLLLRRGEGGEWEAGG